MGDVIYHGTSIMSKYTIYWIYLHGYWMIIIQYNLYIYIQYDHNKYLYGSLYYHGNISNMMYISDMTNIIYNIIYIYIQYISTGHRGSRFLELLIVSMPRDSSSCARSAVDSLDHTETEKP